MDWTTFWTILIVVAFLLPLLLSSEARNPDGR